MLLMARYPEKQRKAQAEIDSVVGADRLPTIADRPDLPYVEALIKETMRWYPAVPLSTQPFLVTRASYLTRLIRYRAAHRGR